MATAAVELPVHCVLCGHPITLVLSDWRPLAPVLTAFDCPSCRRETQLELPGQVVQARGRMSSEMAERTSKRIARASAWFGSAPTTPSLRMDLGQVQEPPGAILSREE